MQTNVDITKGLSFDSSLSNISDKRVIKIKTYNTVYLTTNLLNGKRYVGFHATDDIEDGYLGSGKLITQAIKKYGKSSFHKEILEYCSFEEWKEKETFWINEKNTRWPNGYNLSSGGEGAIGLDPWNKGKTDCYDNETLSLWSTQRKGKPCKNKDAFCPKGRKFSTSHKSNLSIRKLGKNNPMFGKPNWDKINKIKKKCEYCGLETTPGNYGKWHGTRCKHKI